MRLDAFGLVSDFLQWKMKISIKVLLNAMTNVRALPIFITVKNGEQWKCPGLGNG